ncbi:UNVERIFIED_CONTAM: hypothetical protein GTU68_019003 [Idotea baltica]|nr:hypothetical protein [Idotea baltica]
MARIAGVDIPRYKKTKISLTYIFGIGNTTAVQICDRTGIDSEKRVADLNDDEITSIRNEIGEMIVEGELRSEIQMNIKRLMDIGCYRGVRHRKGLPLRGQGTKNNARTRKGRRKTVANKKKATK